MIYTAPCIMFWMRANTLLGKVGWGWALEFKSFLGPVKWHRADRRVPFGAQPPPTCPSTVMDMHASKTLCTGLYKSLVHRWFYEPERPFMHLTDSCRFLISSGWGEGKVGCGRGRSEGDELKGRIKGVMGGCVGSAVRKLFCPVKFSYHTANPPPITLTHRFKPLHPSTPFTLPLQLGPFASPHLPPPSPSGPAIQLGDSRVHKINIWRFTKIRFSSKLAELLPNTYRYRTLYRIM
jgi:hypothetical protein